MRVVLVLAVTFAAGLTGCGDQNCLSIRPWYRGTHSGVYVERVEGPGSSSLALGTMSGPFDTRSATSGSAGCWSPASGVEVPGYRVRAWLDTTRDVTTLSSACDVIDGGTPDCAPGTSDPRGELTFTLPPSGLLTLDLELRDP